MTFEALASGTCVAMLAVLFLFIAFMNLFGSFAFMGSAGAKFVYEMDKVMGGLLAVPYYSKVEAVLMLLAALGAFGIFRADAAVYVVAGLLLALAYLLVCYFYAVYAFQPREPFAVFAALIAAVALWRIFRFLDPALFPTVVFIASVLALLVFAAALQMRRRSAVREGISRRFILIQEFCERNPEFVWVAGRDAPEGFMG